MSRLSNVVDLYYAEQGDYMLGPDGDLADTSVDAYRGLVQQVDTIMQSAYGDWRQQPTLGANLSSYMGRPNTKATAAAMVRMVEWQLLNEDVLRPNEFKIQVIPTSSSSVMIILFVTPTGSSKQLVLNYSYDLRDNKIASRIRR